ncbi:MAG: hypothetical protein RIC16_06865 [Rhodospirillales bacterium]
MTALMGAFPDCNQSSVFCFSVTAAPEPSVMPRLMAVFSQLGLVPDKWYSTLEGRRADGLSVDIQLRGLDAAQAVHLANTMRRIIEVESVLTYEKPSELNLYDAVPYAR